VPLIGVKGEKLGIGFQHVSASEQDRHSNAERKMLTNNGLLEHAKRKMQQNELLRLLWNG
jgi:hypothetical protein